jgi:hypothetical protein
MYDTLAQKKAGSSTATPWNPDSEPTADSWKKAAEVAELKADIDAVIAAIKAVKPAASDVERNVKWKKDTSSDAAKKYSEKALYFVSAEAKQYFDDMGYTEADFADNFNDMKVYFTYEANELPLTYTVTAEEQAIAEAEALYVEAWKSIYADVIAIMGYQGTYKTNLTKKDTNYDKAYKEAAGAEDLQAEIAAFGTVYAANIDAAVAAGKYENALGGKKLYDFYKESATITKAAHVTVAYDMAADAYASELFTLDNIKAKLQAEVDACNNNVALISTLYTYRFVATEKINAAAAAAKYAYTIVEGVKTASGAPTYAYTANSAAGAAYEAKIDALAEAAIEAIKVIKMENKKTTELKDWTGEKILAKDLSLLNYENAVKAIDAVVNNFVGTPGTAVVIDGTTYDAADSQIFQQYKMLIKNNYTGWANLQKAN